MTADKMSPSELAKCRENLRHHWETRKVDKELVQRAWTDAQRVATVLYQKYGASKVAVFGSLAEKERFCKHSDIDIVVWGVSYNRCLDALWETEDLSDEFEIDIIDVRSIHKLYRERILNQAIPIERGEIEPIRIIKETDDDDKSDAKEIDITNQDRLIRRIADEQAKIERTLNGLSNALQDLEIVAEQHRKYVEKTIASDVTEIYRGIENIFEQIAREVDKNIPSGSSWHTDLLDQMAEPREKRPEVITQKTLQRLKQLLKFRHRVNNIYRYDLIFEEAEKHANMVDDLYETLTHELDTFINFLNKT